jgi:hypothetical protein
MEVEMNKQTEERVYVKAVQEQASTYQKRWVKRFDIAGYRFALIPRDPYGVRLYSYEHGRLRFAFGAGSEADARKVAAHLVAAAK